MKAKTIVTTLLLLFVTASFVFLTVKEHKGDQKEQKTEIKQPKTEKSVVKTVAKKSETVVYYFHGNRRCRTCRTIEHYTKEAVNTAFEKEIKSGKMVFKSINLEQSQHEHFVKDYQLSTRSVVLSQQKDGKEVNWKRLDRVWELVRSKPDFITYVQGELKTIIQEHS